MNNLPIQTNSTTTVDLNKIRRLRENLHKLNLSKKQTDYIDEVLQECEYAAYLVEDCEMRLVEQDLELRNRADKLQTFAQMFMYWQSLDKSPTRKKTADQVMKWLKQARPNRYFIETEQLTNTLLDQVRWCYKQ